MRADAKTLGLIIKDYPDFKLVVQGNCDERGSEEYNLGLGDARAKTAREYLSSLGIPAAQINVVSFGQDKPVCAEHSSITPLPVESPRAGLFGKVLATLSAKYFPPRR